MAVWIRSEKDSSSTVQIVVTSEGKRTQTFLPISNFGDSWEGVALVLEGFATWDGWVTRIDADKKAPKGWRVATAAAGVVDSMEVSDAVVQGVAEAGWFDLLERALVGQVGEVGSRGVGFSAIVEWVACWWKGVGRVEIRPIGRQAFLFVFPARCEAKDVLRRR